MKHRKTGNIFNIYSHKSLEFEWNHQCVLRKHEVTSKLIWPHCADHCRIFVVFHHSRKISFKSGEIEQKMMERKNRCQIFVTFISLVPQVLGRLFAPSQKSKKLSHHFRVCFELDFGILNAPRKIFWGVTGPIWELQCLEGVKFQGKKCFTKMASNFSEIKFGFTYHEKMNRK